MPVERSKIHPTVEIPHPELVNIYDSEIGEGTKIASFVEIGRSKIGRFCKIEAYAFIPPGTVIEDYVFVGPHVCIGNDKYPNLLDPKWNLCPVKIKRGTRIGQNTTIAPGVTIGEQVFVKEHSNVTKSIPSKATVCGNPARQLK